MLFDQKKLPKDRAFLKTSIIILCAANAANILNYILQLVLGRTLSTEAFGIFNAVSSLGVILASATSVLPFVASKFIILFNGDVPRQLGLIKYLEKVVFKGVGGSILLLSPLTVYAARYLKIESPVPLLIFMLWTFLLYEMSLFTGILNGLLKYVQTSWQNFFHSFIRLIIILLFVGVFNQSYNSAIFSGVISTTLIIFWMKREVSRALKSREDIIMPTKSEIENMKRVSKPIALSWFCIGILTNIDMILVKIFFMPEDAGLYAGVSVIGRIAVFLPSLLTYALFPQISHNTKSKESSVNHILVAMGLTVAIVAVFYGFVSQFDKFVVNAMLGPKFLPVSDLLPQLSLTMGIISMINVLFTILLAKDFTGFLVPAFLPIGLAFLYLQIHRPDALSSVVGVLLKTSFSVLLLTTFYTVLCFRRRIKRGYNH